MKHAHFSSLARRGFTLVELLIVVVIIAILATIATVGYGQVAEQAITSRAKHEFKIMDEGLGQYYATYGTYPCDVSRNIPPGLDEFLTGDDLDNWPNGPWTGSVYDYDSYDSVTSDGVAFACREPDGSLATGVQKSYDTVQVSIRFCDISGANCRFPRQPWAKNFSKDSSFYYCHFGKCKSHPTLPANHPGYCVNCPDNAAMP